MLAAAFHHKTATSIAPHKDFPEHPNTPMPGRHIMNIVLGRPIEVSLVELDLDGLLIDSERRPKVVWYTIFLTMVQLGIIPEERLKDVGVRTFVQFNGLTPSQIAELGTKIFGTTELFNTAKALRKAACNAANTELGVQQLPHVSAMLAQLGRLSLPRVIVTASKFDDGTAKAQAGGVLESVNKLFGSDAAGSKAERFAAAAQEYSVPFGEVLVLGDAPADVECALQNGMLVAAVPDLCQHSDFDRFAEEDGFLGAYEMEQIVAALADAN
jgi:beta-phosphoglucomutase-like phosphatase (HAD superfamily)